MDETETDRRRFELELEKLKLEHRFVKSGLLVMLCGFLAGGIFLMFKPFKTTALMVVLVGMLVSIMGLITAPRLLAAEFDSLMPK